MSHRFKEGLVTVQLCDEPVELHACAFGHASDVRATLSCSRSTSGCLARIAEELRLAGFVVMETSGAIHSAVSTGPPATERPGEAPLRRPWLRDDARLWRGRPRVGRGA